MDQCIRVHGSGTNGLQFYDVGQNWRDQSLAIYLIFRHPRYYVSPFRPGCKCEWKLTSDRAFLAQLAGASSAAGQNTTRQQVLRGKAILLLHGSCKLTFKGIHIYMGGIGLQQAFILLFLFLAIKFHRELLQEHRTEKTSRALQLLYVEYAVLVLITVSCPHSSIAPINHQNSHH